MASSREPEDHDRWRTPVVSGDGSTILIRPLLPADRAAMVAFHAAQSPESTYRRYFTARRELSDVELDRFTTTDLTTGAVLGAFDGDDLVGVGCWFRRAGRTDAEVAFQVDDRHQGRGLATVLLEHLAAIAVAAGITRFTAETLGDNRAMLAVFSKAGWPVEKHFESGVIELGWPLEETAGYVDSVERREQLADSRSMARLLYPDRLAIIGASEKEGSVGRSITEAVLASFSGQVHLVNPNKSAVLGRPTIANIAAIEERVDLALVVVPSSQLVAVIDACIEHRVRGAIVYTATDIDFTPIVRRAREHGLRIIGPASMGVIGNRPDRTLQASLAPGAPRRGGLALSLQSGALGAAILERTERLGVGVSWFVSLGDRADVSGNDLLQFFDDDDATSVIGIYTERFGNPRKFARIARRVAKRRPIVAVEASGFEEADALYGQAGVINVPTVVELVDVARVLVRQPLPRSSKVMIITNAASPMRMTKNAVLGAGLDAVTMELPWDITPDAVDAAVRQATGDPEVGSVIVIYAPPLARDLDSWSDAIERGAAASPIPVLAVVLGKPDGLTRPDGVVPAFAFPEQAVDVLARSWSYARWRAAAGADALPPPPNFDGAAVDLAITGNDGPLQPAALTDLLRAAGIDVARTVNIAIDTALVESSVDGLARTAVAASDEIGLPVAVKVDGPRPLGRSARAGVALDLSTAEEVRNAVATVADTIKETGTHDRVLNVQEMVPPGLEVRVEISVHPALGPLVAVGLGGQGSTAAGPPQKRLAPITPDEAADMIDRAGLAGVLLANDISTTALVDLVVRAGCIAVEASTLESLVLDPIMVSARRCVVTDAAGTTHHVDPEGPIRRLD